MSDSSDLPPTSCVEDRPLQGAFWRRQVTHLRAFLSAHRWAIFSLVGMTLVLYAPAVGYEFLNLDDHPYLTQNELIKSWHPLNLWRVMTEPVARNYAPLTIGTFLVEHTLWGLNPSGYHATNIALHALNAVLVFALMRQLTQNRWTAWIVAALFAVHPMQIESVVWVSSRKTLLSSTFMLLSGLCYLRPARSGRSEAWGALWLALGLLSKASTVSIPPIVVAYDMFIRRRSFAAAVVPQILPGVLCVLLINYTMSAQLTVIGGTSEHLVMNKLQIAGVDATLMFRYLALLALPDRLCIYYSPPWQGIGLQIAAAVTCWVALTVFLWKKRTQYPRLAFAWATWLWLLFPVMNFFPITTLMNDRYMYLPCLVVFWMAAEGLKRLSERSSSGAAGLGVRLARGLCFTAIAAYAFAAHHYLPVWRNSYTVWNHARQVTPALVIVHRKWGDALQESGDIDGALAELQFALDHLHPSEAETTLIKSLQVKWSAKRK